MHQLQRFNNIKIIMLPLPVVFSSSRVTPSSHILRSSSLSVNISTLPFHRITIIIGIITTQTVPTNSSVSASVASMRKVMGQNEYHSIRQHIHMDNPIDFSNRHHWRPRRSRCLKFQSCQRHSRSSASSASPRLSPTVALPEPGPLKK